MSAAPTRLASNAAKAIAALSVSLTGMLPKSEICGERNGIVIKKNPNDT